MKKLILIIGLFLAVTTVKSQDTIRGISIQHNFYLIDSTTINQLFEKVSYTVDSKTHTISCRVKFYRNRSDAQKDTLSLIFGSDVMILDNLYRVNYSGTSYTYETLPSNIYTDALNHCKADILYYNSLEPPYPDGIKNSEITIY